MFNDKYIRLNNMISISDVAAVVAAKVKGFIPIMKLVAAHIFYVHCINTDSIVLQKICHVAYKKYSTLPHIQ